MKTQDHLCAPLVETHLRSKDTEKLQAEGAGTGTLQKWNCETNKWILFEYPETVSRKKPYLATMNSFGFSSDQR